MALKQYKPTSPSRRQLVTVDRSSLYSGDPIKSLSHGQSKSGGRNNTGRITAWQRGGGHKRRYRIIDFKRTHDNLEATVVRIEYDPNRSSFIALLKYEDEKLTYIISPQKLNVGDKVISGDKVDIKPGNTMPLKNMPMGTIIHNIELKIGKGGQVARSAGTYAQLVGKDRGYAIIKLQSGEQRLVRGECRATVGSVSNPDHQNINLGKAGRSRWLGRRPNVRGVVMNPVDHPHGGGEGRTSGGRHPVSPWGTPAKGFRTRNNKRTDNMRISRRPSNKR